MSFIIQSKGKGQVRLVDEKVVDPTDAELADRDADITLDLRNMVGTGTPDETGKQYHSITSLEGKKGDADWYPFKYNPAVLDKDRTIKTGQRVMMTGPFEIPQGMTITVEADASFVVI